jgi:tyrosine-protein kinase Etk/Wzc
MQADNNRVVISGPSPGIGKSFISTNLAYLLAETGKKVVVVDADMRKGHCHELFGQARDAGLSEYISQQALDVDEVLKQHPKNEQLSLISTGAIPPNPSELLLSPRFRDLLDQLSDRFDMVIIDTPPIMAVADAGIVLPHAAAAFVIARVGVNPVDELGAAVKRLTQDGGKISGVLLNGMDRSSSGSAGYSYYQYEYK